MPVIGFLPETELGVQSQVTKSQDVTMMESQNSKLTDNSLMNILDDSLRGSQGVNIKDDEANTQDLLIHKDPPVHSTPPVKVEKEIVKLKAEEVDFVDPLPVKSPEKQFFSPQKGVMNSDMEVKRLIEKYPPGVTIFNFKQQGFRKFSYGELRLDKSFKYMKTKFKFRKSIPVHVDANRFCQDPLYTIEILSPSSASSILIKNKYDYEKICNYLFYSLSVFPVKNVQGYQYLEKGFLDLLRNYGFKWSLTWSHVFTILTNYRANINMILPQPAKSSNPKSEDSSKISMEQTSELSARISQLAKSQSVAQVGGTDEDQVKMPPPLSLHPETLRRFSISPLKSVKPDDNMPSSPSPTKCTVAVPKIESVERIICTQNSKSIIKSVLKPEKHNLITHSVRKSLKFKKVCGPKSKKDKRKRKRHYVKAYIILERFKVPVHQHLVLPLKSVVKVTKRRKTSSKLPGQSCIAPATVVSTFSLIRTLISLKRFEWVQRRKFLSTKIDLIEAKSICYTLLIISQDRHFVQDKVLSCIIKDILSFLFKSYPGLLRDPQIRGDLVVACVLDFKPSMICNKSTSWSFDNIPDTMRRKGVNHPLNLIALLDSVPYYPEDAIKLKGQMAFLSLQLMFGKSKAIVPSQVKISDVWNLVAKNMETWTKIHSSHSAMKVVLTLMDTTVSCIGYEGFEEDTLNTITKENVEGAIVKENIEDNETEVGATTSTFGDSDQDNTSASDKVGNDDHKLEESIEATTNEVQKQDINAEGTTKAKANIKETDINNETPKTSSQESHKINSESTTITSVKDDFETPKSGFDLPTPCRKDSRPSLSCLNNIIKNQSQSPIKSLHKEGIAPITPFDTVEDKENSQEIYKILTPVMDITPSDSQEIKCNGEASTIEENGDKTEKLTLMNTEQLIPMDIIESTPTDADLPVPDKIEIDDDPSATVAKLEAIFKKLGADGGKKLLKIPGKKCGLVLLLVLLVDFQTSIPQDDSKKSDPLRLRDYIRGIVNRWSFLANL